MQFLSVLRFSKTRKIAKILVIVSTIATNWEILGMLIEMSQIFIMEAMDTLHAPFVLLSDTSS